MKITKHELRRIIKEEKARVLREQGMPGIEGPVRDLWGSKEDQAAQPVYDEIDQMTKNHLGAKIEEAIALAQEAQAAEVLASLIEAHEALQEW
jgi:hypothetical protein